MNRTWAAFTVSMLGYYSRVLKAPGSSLKASTYSPSLELFETTDQEEKLDKTLSKLELTAYIISLAFIGQNPAGLSKVLVC